MGSRRNGRPPGSDFPRAAALAIRDRFLHRVERHETSKQTNKPASWSYSVIRNKSKMAPRFLNAVQPDPRSSLWELALRRQTAKLKRLLDPYQRWVKRESYILSELNEVGFPQEPIHKHGFAWAYTARLQQKKLTVTVLPGLRRDSRRWPGWNGVLNRIHTRVPRLVEQPIRKRDPWEYVIGGMQQRLRDTRRLDHDWRPVILRASRRNWNS